MAVIPEITCRRCGSKYSGLRSRCPKCGAPRVNQPTRVPPTTSAATPATAASGRAAVNIRWQFIFAGVLVLALILAVVVLVNSNKSSSPAQTSAMPGTPAGQGTATYVSADLPTPSPSPEPTPDASPTPVIESMAIASFIVLPNLLSDRRDAAGQIVFHGLSEAEKANIRVHDLAVIRDPYVAIGLVVLVMFVAIALTKMPTLKGADEARTSAGTTLSRLWHNGIYRYGVLAQVLYVAAQIMVWTFIIQYADHLGIDKASAQRYNIRQCPCR